MDHRRTQPRGEHRAGSQRCLDELGFRDYLRAHRETARDDERLKRELAVRHCNDREASMLGTSDFVQKVLARASSA
jgi:GrpB-like predicted nucleotidyltransferase (UPF0157 family)